MADFAHHTDDLHVAAVVEYEVRTERVQAAEVLADQRRVGDGHLPSPRVVSGIEVAPREQGNPERCDPARRRPARLRRGSLGGGQGRPADDGEVGSHIEARQRQHLADSGASGTWKEVSRISSGVRVGIRSRSSCISSRLRTRGSLRSRLGEATRSAGFAVTRPARRSDP